MKLSAAKIGFSAENIEFIDDLVIENSQCYEQAEIYSNILASMMDARASIVSNNLNWLMKTLTIITIAIMLPTLVVSIFSMNVTFPGREHPLDVLDRAGHGSRLSDDGTGRVALAAVVSAGRGKSVRTPLQVGIHKAAAPEGKDCEAMFQRRVTRTLEVINPSGLHARPCLAIMNTVRLFKSRVEFRKGSEVVDASEILQLMSLGAAQGTKLVVTANGPDAQQVVAALEELFSNHFGL